MINMLMALMNTAHKHTRTDKQCKQGDGDTKKEQKRNARGTKCYKRSKERL